MRGARRYSTENAIIATHADRWPLLIDPQRQANSWLKRLERGSNLAITRLNDQHMSRILRACIQVSPALFLCSRCTRRSRFSYMWPAREITAARNCGFAFIAVRPAMSPGRRRGAAGLCARASAREASVQAESGRVHQSGRRAHRILARLPALHDHSARQPAPRGMPQ